MKVTLTAIASQYIHMPLAPFCLKKAVEERMPQTRVTICDLNVNETPEALLRRLMVTDPDVLGFSLYIWNRAMTARLIRMVKALRPDITVAVGGPEATWDVDGVFAQVPCDVVLRGPGEASLPLLLKALAGQVLTNWTQGAFIGAAAGWAAVYAGRFPLFSVRSCKSRKK